MGFFKFTRRHWPCNKRSTRITGREIIPENMQQQRTTKTALVWSAAETFGHQGVQLVVYIFLARLVSPEEFGLAAMLTVFFSVGQILADSGFSNALIQKKDADQLDRSTVFYFNLVVGVLLSGLLCLASGWIAEFYNQPVLQPLSMAMSLMILFTSFGLIQQALTRKEMDFLTRAKSAVIAALLAGGISLTLAYQGAGVWALAAQMILMRLFQSLLLWVFHHWRPDWAFSFSRLREMSGFGSKMLAAGLFNAFFSNLSILVIGKVYTPTDVGYYSNAWRYERYVANNLTTVLSRVTLPAFSRHQDDLKQLRELFIKFLRVGSIAIFPVMGLLCGIASPLFETVLGPQWLPSAPLFQILCIVALFHPLSSINLNCLLAQGKSGHFLMLEITKRAGSVINLLITYRYGIFWVIVGEAALSLLGFLVNTYFTGKYLSVNGFQQIGIVSKNLVLAVLVAATAYLGTLLPVLPFWKMCVGAVSGGITGLAFILCFDRQTFLEFYGLLSGFLPRRRITERT